MKNVVKRGLEKTPSQRLNDAVNRLGYLIDIGVTEREPLECLMRDFRRIQTDVAGLEKREGDHLAILGVRKEQPHPGKPQLRTSDDIIGGAI